MLKLWTVFLSLFWLKIVFPAFGLTNTDKKERLTEYGFIIFYLEYIGFLFTVQ